jgi:hypothetical protein
MLKAVSMNGQRKILVKERDVAEAVQLPEAWNGRLGCRVVPYIASTLL